MTRRAPLLALLAVVTTCVSGCVNDYDQFDFTLGQHLPSQDGGPWSGPTDDGPASDGGSWSDETSDAGADASEEPPIDASSGEPRLELDGAPDASDATEVSDAVDGGRFDDTSEAAPMADAGDAGDAIEDAVDADASMGDDRSANTDASATEDGAEDGESSVSEDASLDADASVEDGTGAIDVGCGVNEKRCGADCVPANDPLTGCGNATCDPCVLPHAGARCADDGTCAISVCGAGFDDCDGLAANGCETSIMNDVAHCGACRRACSDTNVLSRECAGGLCVSTCALGFANCNAPRTGADDGCERAVSTEAANCGGCGNDCRQQGGGLTCGIVANTCGCVDNSSCRTEGSTGSCQATGLCKCGPTVCKSGETCRAADGPDVCSCNGAASCAGAETCCQTPAGCRDLRGDPSNCGACGRACPYGFFCSAGACSCNADSQCDAGSPGTCAAGQCACQGTLCAPGQRCLADGHCG